MAPYCSFSNLKRG